MLTSKQKQDYEDHGFLLLKGLLGPKFLDRLSSHFEELVLGNVEPAPSTVLMKDVMVARGAVEPKSKLHAINKLLNFEDDPILYEYATDSGLLAAVRDLIGNDVYTIVSNVFNKPPEVDGRHPLHQDLRYFRIRPPEGILASWTAISECTRESGCIAVVPGSHKGELLDHRMPDWEHVNFAFYGIERDEKIERVHIEMESGDTLLFHPLLIHGSGRNRTNDFRRSISVHFASASCTSPPPDWRDNDRVRHIG